MPASIDRLNDFRVVIRRVPPREPAAHAIEERERRRTVGIASVLPGLLNFVPSAPAILSVDNHELARALSTLWGVVATDRPSLLPIEELNPAKFEGCLAVKTFSLCPCDSKRHSCGRLSLPEGRRRETDQKNERQSTYCGAGQQTIHDTTTARLFVCLMFK